MGASVIPIAAILLSSHNWRDLAPWDECITTYYNILHLCWPVGHCCTVVLLHNWNSGPTGSLWCRSGPYSHFTEFLTCCVRTWSSSSWLKPGFTELGLSYHSALLPHQGWFWGYGRSRKSGNGGRKSGTWEKRHLIGPQPWPWQKQGSMIFLGKSLALTIRRPRENYWALVSNHLPECTMSAITATMPKVRQSGKSQTGSEVWETQRLESREK